MHKRRWWTVPLLASFLAVVSLAGAAEDERGKDERRKDERRKDERRKEGKRGRGKEGKKERHSHRHAGSPSHSPDHNHLDALIHKTLRKVINEGADLYNGGDHEGCYRLWQGSLLTLKPLLGHHPELQKEIDEALAKPVCPAQLSDRDFALRRLLEKIRRATMPRPEHLPHPSSGPPSASRKSLWDRLGGEKGVSDVVSTFLKVASNDSRINFWRKPNYKPSDKQVEDAKKEFIDWISSQTGGPHEYKGKDMREVHKGMGITNAEFDAAAEDLRMALSVHGVPSADANLLMNIVGRTRGEIVQMPVAPEGPAKK